MNYIMYPSWTGAINVIPFLHPLWYSVSKFWQSLFFPCHIFPFLEKPTDVSTS